jgi:hypothetical protein
MEKGKSLFSSFRSRRNAKVSLNMDDERDFEWMMLYQVEALQVNATRWQNPKMLKALHIKEDFAFFLEYTWLEGFASRPYKTYAELTREFLATFKFVHTKTRHLRELRLSPPSLMLNSPCTKKDMLCLLRNFAM